MASDRTVAIYPAAANAPGGYDATYTTMALMEAGENGDLTSGGGTRLLVEITDSDGSWNGAPDQQANGVTFGGWTYDRSSGEYIHIYTLTNCRSSTGNWDTAGYILEYTGNGEAALNFSETSEIDFTGIQVETSDTTAWAGHIGISFDAAASMGVNFYKTYFRGLLETGNNDYHQALRYTAASTGIQLLQNCIIERWFHGPKSDNLSGTLKIYNCTLYNISNDGIECSTGTETIKNTAVGGTGDDWDTDPNTIDFCSSDDGNASDSNHVDLSPDANELTDHHEAWTDPDGAPPDFTIKDTNSVLYLASDISNADDSDVPTDDIAGNSRNSGAGEAVCIGAFEYPAAGGISIPVVQHHRRRH